MIPRAIISTLFDLLQLEGKGNLAQFDRYFRKTCNFFSLTADDATMRKLRNIAFWYLRNAGYVDASYGTSTTVWTTAPESLVQLGDHDFAVIAGTEKMLAIAATVPSTKLGALRSPDTGLVPETIQFFPTLLCLKASIAEAQALAHQMELSLSASFQSQIFQHLPSIDSVLRGAIVRADGEAHFEPKSADRFDFISATWQRFAETRAVDHGLYRQRFEYGRPRYAIVAPWRGRPAELLQVEREWILVAALALLRKALPIRYDKDTQRLYMSKRYHPSLRLPTLLERCLRAGTLLNPSSSREWFVYDRILGSSVASLIDKLPIFSIEGKR